MKDHKGKLILSSLLVLLPLAAGLLLWNRLPEQLPMHWNAAGEIDGWGSRLMVVCAEPLFLLVIHWVCVVACLIDPKNKGQNRKALGLVLWICPAISILCGGLMYAFALGYEVNIGFWLMLLIGVVFIVAGNYLPKSRQNYTVGIKIPWTLSDVENWNATHRFAGRLWMAAGVVILATAWLGQPLVFFPIVVLMVAAPVLYSYLYFRKKH